MRPKWAQRDQRLQFAEWALSFGLSEREKKNTHTEKYRMYEWNAIELC